MGGNGLTKSRIQHIQCHLVTLLRPGNGNKTLVAILLRLINLDNTTTQMPDLVNLSTALPDNGTDHVIRDINLLREWLTRQDAADGCSAGAAAGLCSMRGTVGTGLVGTRASVGWVRSRAVGHGGRRLRDGGWDGLAVEVRNAVGARHESVGVVVVALEGVRVAVLASGRLRDVRDDLHAAGDGAGGTAAAGCVRGGCGAAEAFCELLD